MTKDKTATVHLLRGSPCVRSWSKYQQTVERWTLCGIDRGKSKENVVTEDPGKVTCRFCCELAEIAASVPKAASAAASPTQEAGS